MTDNLNTSIVFACEPSVSLHYSQNSSSVPIKGELLNSLIEISFHFVLQYSILEENISMFKRRLASKKNVDFTIGLACR